MGRPLSQRAQSQVESLRRLCQLIDRLGVRRRSRRWAVWPSDHAAVDLAALGVVDPAPLEVFLDLLEIALSLFHHRPSVTPVGDPGGREVLAGGQEAVVSIGSELRVIQLALQLTEVLLALCHLSEVAQSVPLLRVTREVEVVPLPSQELVPLEADARCDPAVPRLGHREGWRSGTDFRGTQQLSHALLVDDLLHDEERVVRDRVQDLLDAAMDLCPLSVRPFR